MWRGNITNLKNENMCLNKEISDYFLSDCRDYLIRYEVLRDNFTHIGNRSKLLVDLIFSLECLLKSIIFIESTDSASDTYSKIKTHDLKKLSKRLSSESYKKYRECIKEDLTKYQVHIRYKVECEIDFRNNIGCYDNRYYDTIANHIWLDNIYSQITDLLSYVNKINPTILNFVDLNNINIDYVLYKAQTINNLRKK